VAGHAGCCPLLSKAAQQQALLVRERQSCCGVRLACQLLLVRLLLPQWRLLLWLLLLGPAEEQVMGLPALLLVLAVAAIQARA
jgi:hypothetical protein